jgi:hypothetical protein
MSELNPDWDKLQSAHETIREHMKIVAKLRGALEQCIEALQWGVGGEPLPSLELEAIENAKRVIAEVEGYE